MDNSDNSAYTKDPADPPPPQYNDVVNGQTPGYPQPQMQQNNGMPISGQPQPGYGGTQGMQEPPVQWMNRPETLPGCPPGLEYLTTIDQLLVHQQVNVFEVMTMIEVSNRYQIKNSMGQQVYFAMEESDALHRQMARNARGFIMHIVDNMNQEVMRIMREFKACAGCPCCANSDGCAMMVSIEAPPGNVIGYVRQGQACRPKYTVMDGSEQVIFTILGPTCICQGPCCTNDQEFVVYSPDLQHEVGKISKQFTGFGHLMVGGDNFGITFPMDLDVKMKANMLGALFLIDFMYFEVKHQQRRRRH